MAGKSQTVDKNCVGIFSHPSRLLLPPGALRQAHNCVLGQEGICGKRRGVNRYGDELDGPADEEFEYLKTLIQFTDGVLSYDSDGEGTWAEWDGEFNPPDDGIPMRAIEENGNFYFTTNAGPYVNDAIDGIPVRAGMPPGLDTQLETTGVGGSWFLPDSQVGYRIVWMRKDANENEKRGIPSFQETVASPIFTGLAWSRSTTTATVTHEDHGYTTGDIIEVSESSDVTAIIDGTKEITVDDSDTYHFTCLDAGDTSGTLSAGKAFDVELIFTIPLTDGVVEGDYYEIHRTDLSATEDDAPSDEHRLIIRNKVTSTDIATGTVTFTDDRDPSFLKESLYTNQNNGEGLNQGNGRPPFCTCVATYQGHTFYGDFLTEEFVEIQLLDVESLSDDSSSITIKLGGTEQTYTFSAAENQGANKFQRFTTSGEGTLAAAVRKTAKSLVKIINRDDSQEDFWAFYASTPTEAPGRIIIQSRKVNVNEISITCDDDTTTGPSFSPELPESGTAVHSTNNTTEHGLLRSKFQQPEAVPFFNKHKIGSRNKRILALVALKEALLIFKEDGLFYLSGKTDGSGGFNFTDDRLDPSVILVGRRNTGVLDSAVVAFTTQGIMRCSPSGTSILSRQIENDLLRASKFSNFTEKSFIVTYESERSLLFWVPEENSSETADFAWVFNYINPGWTTYDKPASCGLVKSDDDRLYLGHAVDPFILKERKERLDTNEDFLDEDIPADVDSFDLTANTVEVSWDYDTDPAEGWLFKQETFQSVVTAVEKVSETDFILTLREEIGSLDIDGCTVTMPVDQLIEWAPEDIGSAAALKFFSVGQVYVEVGAGPHRLGFKADTMGDSEFVDDFERDSTSGWGSGGWGEGEWGVGIEELPGELRTVIPLNHRKCRALSTFFQNRYALENPKVEQLSLDVRSISSRTEREGSRVA